jgi:hypothetical protein
MGLVLCSQDGPGVGPGQPEAFGNQGGGQRTVLLVRREHALPSPASAPSDLLRNEPVDIKGGQGYLAREAKQIEAGPIELRFRAGVQGDPVEVVREDRTDAWAARCGVIVHWAESDRLGRRMAVEGVRRECMRGLGLQASSVGAPECATMTGSIS